jgi:hypothetical protein
VVTGHRLVAGQASFTHAYLLPSSAPFPRTKPAVQGSPFQHLNRVKPIRGMIVAGRAQKTHSQVGSDAIRGFPGQAESPAAWLPECEGR